MVSEISQSVKDKYRMIYFYVESNEQDKNRSIDTWNRLTAVRGEDEGVDWMKEGERISQRTYMHPWKLTTGGDCLRELCTGWRWAKGKKWGPL